MASSTSSPVVPAGAKQLRIKRRVINLVNPADPQEFSNSNHSLSPRTSPNVSLEQQEPLRHRESTPDHEIPQLELPALTPRRFDDDGLRGILRPSGTPGSGNGVRFFPKNRFRVITPNQPHVPTPQKPPPSPSFFSHLLSVVPTMSPRRSTTPPLPVDAPVEVDESWEVPGQEGEVSLVGSSVGSESGGLHSRVAEAEAEAEEAEVHGSLMGDNSEAEISWSGVPEVHCSPLALPAENNSREVSYQELDLPSADLHVPEDMSNLLSTRMSPTQVGISWDMSMPVPTSPLARRLSGGVASGPDQHASFLSVGESSASISLVMEDDNPTIRRRISPIARHNSNTVEPETPTPAPPSDLSNTCLHTPPPPLRPFTSIFADMSAEQAELTWPLSQHVEGAKLEEDDTAFHSAVFTSTDGVGVGVGLGVAELADLPIAPSTKGTMQTTPPSNKTPAQVNASWTTPRAGDVTVFFDATSSLLTPPSPLSSVLVPTRQMPLPMSRSPLAPDLVHPTQALLTAQSAHTAALSSELALYRSLAHKLQAEVAERDAVLSDLNVRALESEMLRAQLSDLQVELAALKAGQRSIPSPSPSPPSMKATLSHHPGDRTTVVESEKRDLEIRLAKALADGEVMGKQLGEIRGAKDDLVKQLASAQARVGEVEERERDREVAATRVEEERRGKVESLQEEVDELRREVQSEQEERERVQEELDTAQAEMAEMADEEQRKGSREESLQEEVESLREQLETFGAELEQERGAREEVEREIEQERSERVKLETVNRELKKALRAAKADQASSSATSEEIASLRNELARLRSESASKDLEIVNLERRKAELKEDREMFNIALDSKQQELELVKRKYARVSTPLTASRRQNDATPTSAEIDTPAPSKLGLGDAPSTARPRRSSAAYTTPVVSARSGRHGVPLHASTIKTARVMRSVAEEENRPPNGEGVGVGLRGGRVASHGPTRSARVMMPV
ncbi:hypothetical protein EHS25_003827 [Saitozyma podzolica]|uniref:Uncharacterized protein n=1 Tax=Saitozyma podzolica TaxID=1890683 RepID=A0A427Y3M8_9TREE|nr:hypothetical protein EHS25_003827 [Saitozyma podzolica]